MKKWIFIVSMAMTLMVTNITMAMKSMDHSKMNHDSGMAMGGDTIMLQDTEVDGILASAHLMDVKEKMAKHGMATTHHFMVGFMDGAKKMVSKGQVALKIESPDGKVSKPHKLMGMSGQFGTDVTLDQRGMYHFMVGTKLADGNNRMFHMHYDNE